MLTLAAVVLLSAAPAPSPAEAKPPVRASLWLTAKGTGERLASKEPVVFESMPQPDEAFPTVMVDPSKAFQVIEGIGGALTDAAAETFAKLPKERQGELLDAYFDPVKGIGYSLGRTHIDSCDFSSVSYAYAEPGEKEGVPIWRLTVQNEPMATQTCESRLITGEEERDSVRDHLGPALEKAGLGRLELMIWDHSRGILYQHAKAVYDDPAASRYDWGAGFHWYVGDHFHNIGHVSKFVRPGARRVATTTNDDELLATAFVHPDGRLVAVVMNRTDTDKDMALGVGGPAAKTRSPAHSILTLAW